MMADGGRLGLDDLDAAEIAPVDVEGLKAETKRLNALGDAEYELERAKSAKRYGVRPSYFDNERRKARPKSDDDGEAEGQSPIEDLEAWPERVDGASLAAEIRDRLRAHVVFERASDADALAVWIIGAYAMDVWGRAPAGGVGAGRARSPRRSAARGRR
jgi:hypothetical protein